MVGSIAGLFVVIAQVAVPVADQVTIDRSHYEALIAEPTPEPGLTWVQHRQLELTLADDGVHLHGRWTLQGRGADADVVSLWRLLPATAHIQRATWNGAPAGLWTSGDWVTVAAPVGERSVLEVEAQLPPLSQSGGELHLLGATTGTVAVSADSPTVVSTLGAAPVLGQEPLFVTGATDLRIEPRQSSAATRDTVTVGRSAVGLTVGDASITGYARASWIVRRGALDRVALQARGLGADLEVLGDNVERWSRQGDRITVELKAPSNEAVHLQLRWTNPISTGSESTLPIPSLALEDTLSHEATLELARDGEVDAVPRAPGWTPLASQQLPDWGRGLIRGAATAAYRRGNATTGEAGQLELFRFEPVPGPQVVVDIADVTVTTAASGRTLMSARYEITNERADALEITPPPHARLVGAWIAGRRVTVARVGERLRIPLPRSIETVDGLLGFPLLVAFMGESPTWKRSEHRQLPLPKVQAPVNVARVTLRLPRHYRSRLQPGDDPRVVSAFTRGEEVAYGLDNADLIATADVIYRDAIDAWNANDFERARQRLGELEQIGAKSTHQEGLEGNVSMVLTGPLAAAPAIRGKRSREGETEEQLERRIRAQARARAGKLRADQRQHKVKAQALKDAGRYEEAADEYEQAAAATQTLRQLDEDESYEYQFEAEELEADMKANAAAAEARDMLEVQSQLWSGGVFASAARRPAPPLSATAPIVLPQVGERIRYQFLLLEPGAARSVPIDARKRRSFRRRKESSR